MENGSSGGSEDSGAAPETWEVADVEESMKRLMLPPSAKESAGELGSGTVSSSGVNAAGSGGGGVSEDALNQVDQFLREALQNPRERLSVLRIEQEVEKLVRDPTRDHLEFQHLPTSYLRLAAHRVAQHYFLQSMVLTDNSLPDCTGSKIIIQKTSNEYRLPRVRLSDIPVNLSHHEHSGAAIKVAIKQRPQGNPLIVRNGNSSSVKSNNHSKSVEERKEEYNRARARIFNSSNVTVAKPEVESNKADTLLLDQRCIAGSSGVNSGRGLVESSSRSARSSRVENDPVSRYRPSNRVAIFRDHEIERSDPDYDRSYDRYMQRFDPGFGFNAGPYTIQPMYTRAINYNTEFPQLGSTHGPQVPAEAQRPPPPPPPHMHGPWASPSSPSGLGYGHPDTMMTVYNPSHVNARSTSALFLHPSQYLPQHPGMPFVHTHEHIHHPYPQSQQPLHDSTLGLARPH